MSKRFFKDSITLYHFEDEDNVSIVHFDAQEDNGVYFRHNKKSNLIDKGLSKGSTGSITIPTTDTLDISEDDYVIEGIINDEFDLKNLIKNYQSN